MLLDLRSSKRSLRNTILFWVWLVSASSTFAFTSIQLFVDYNKEENIAVEQIAVIKKNYLPSINKSLWDFNTNYLELQLRNVRNLPYVRFVEIRSDDMPELQTVQSDTTSLRLETMPLNFNSQNIGVLVVGLDIVGIQKQFFMKLAYFFFYQALKTLIVCFLLLRIFEKVIMGHLVKIAEYLNSFDLHDGTNLKLDREKNIEDELSMLVTSINGLKNDLSATSRKLQVLNMDLENKVIERTRLLDEERARSMQSAKLASLGEMAGGIAHEINNPLAIISSVIQFLKKSIDRKKLTDEILIESITTIEATVLRTSKIIKGLRTVSHSSENFEKSPTMIKDILDDVLGLCTEKFKNHGVRIEIPSIGSYSDKLIECDRVQLSQVLINLLGNSFDAIYESDEKWVRIELNEDSNFEIIKISDSGPGIPEEIVQKIFNPFFTSKEVGKGTGLGLSISRSIMTKHKGSIEIDTSSLNTCFILKLPK